MTANLRYWQAVLRAAEAELDAAATHSELKIAARKFVRARRQVAQLTKQEANRPARRQRRSIARPAVNAEPDGSSFEEIAAGPPGQAQGWPRRRKPGV